MRSSELSSRVAPSLRSILRQPTASSWFPPRRHPSSSRTWPSQRVGSSEPSPRTRYKAPLPGATCTRTARSGTRESWRLTTPMVSAWRTTSKRSLQPWAEPSTPEVVRSEEHTSELQSRSDLVCRLLLEKKNKRLLDRHYSLLLLSLSQPGS